MNRRTLLVLTLAGALALPAVALAAGSSAPGHGRLTALVERVSHRLDRRFAVFSSRCLVEDAPARCAAAASRVVRRLDALERRVGRVKARVQRICSAAHAPAACAGEDELLRKLDELAARAASDEAAVRARYPGA